MPEVTWFKVLTDIFSDDKIKILQSMPEGDSLLVMWFKVLAQAGKTNDGGYIYLKKNIPYTAGMLSTLFGKQQQLVEMAMRTFTEFGMIDIDENGYVFVTNWEKHQSIDALQKIKEQDRLRAANYRERKRLELKESHVTVTLPSQPNHATEVELDLELEKEKNTTTNADTYTETITDANKKVFGTLMLNGLLQEYIFGLMKKGYTETFIVELMLETGESATKPTLRLMQTIGERWMKEGIYTRAESKRRHEESKIRTSSTQPSYQAPKEYIPDPELLEEMRELERLRKAN